MAYGKIKADTLVYDNNGTDTDVTIASLGAKADLNSPTFTGTPTVPGYAALAGATFTGNVVMSANLTVQGTTTTISSTTIEVADKNLELGKVDTPTDTTADGGGITLKGATDKTFNWVDATDAWTSSEHINLGDNKKLLLGTGSDLQVYHSGSSSWVYDNGTGPLYLATNNSNVEINGGSSANDTMAKFKSTEGVELYFNNSKKIETTTAGVTVTGDVSDSKGNLRDISYNLNNDNYTLVAADRGKMVGNSVASKTTTIPASVFGTGQVVSILNPSSGDHTIAAGSGFTLINTADAATGNRTLASKGMATVYFTSATEGYISGTGLS